jgi:DNA-binding MarR family transcriptional regulator
MKDKYFESVVMVERLYRLFLDVIKKELEKENIHDINNVQAIVLYHIGTGQITVGELTNRGYYLGSNVSYNLRKMVNFGYVDQIPSPHDKRAVFIKLSEKGLKLHNILDVVFERHANQLGDIEAISETLLKLEKFWKN